MRWPLITFFQCIVLNQFLLYFEEQIASLDKKLHNITNGKKLKDVNDQEMAQSERNFHATNMAFR